MNINNIIACTLIAGIAAPGAVAVAQSPSDTADIKACQAITSDLGRLNCFDALARQSRRAEGDGGAKSLTADTPVAPSPAAPPPVSPPPGPLLSAPQPPGATQGAWLHRQSVDGLDQSMVESAVLPAATGNVGLLNKPGLQHGPALVIRCKEKQTAVFVAFDLAVTGPAELVPVQYRIGPTQPAAGQWGRSQDNQAFGFWDTPHAVALIQSLLGQDEFYVRASPPGKGQVEAGFKLAGIDAAIRPVRAACGW